MATSADGTRIAWYRYGGGERTILFVPTGTSWMPRRRAPGGGARAARRRAHLRPSGCGSQRAAEPGTPFRSTRPMRSRFWTQLGLTVLHRHGVPGHQRGPAAGHPRSGAVPRLAVVRRTWNSILLRPRRTRKGSNACGTTGMVSSCRSCTRPSRAGLGRRDRGDDRDRLEITPDVIATQENELTGPARSPSRDRRGPDAIVHGAGDSPSPSSLPSASSRRCRRSARSHPRRRAPADSAAPRWSTRCCSISFWRRRLRPRSFRRRGSTRILRRTLLAPPHLAPCLREP